MKVTKERDFLIYRTGSMGLDLNWKPKIWGVYARRKQGVERGSEVPLLLLHTGHSELVVQCLQVLLIHFLRH